MGSHEVGGGVRKESFLSLALVSLLAFRRIAMVFRYDRATEKSSINRRRSLLQMDKEC